MRAKRLSGRCLRFRGNSTVSDAPTGRIQHRAAGSERNYGLTLTVGIPHKSPFGYYVKNVLYTQYFTPDGASLHDNYWYRTSWS